MTLDKHERVRTVVRQWMRDAHISPRTGFLAEQPSQLLPHRFGVGLGDRFLHRMDEIAYNLEVIIRADAVRKTILDLPPAFLDLRTLSWADSHRLMLILAMLMHAYFREHFRHEHGYTTVAEVMQHPKPEVLPRQIAIPLWQLHVLTERQPSMGYGLYADWNWKFMKEEEISLDTIDVLHTFTGTLDERWFIRIHQVIDYQFARAIEPLLTACLLSSDASVSLSVIEHHLWQAANPAQRIVDTLKRVRERCKPDTHFNEIRMFYTIPRAIIFEGVPGLGGRMFDIPGEIGGQNPNFHLIFAALSMRKTRYHKRNARQLDRPIQRLIRAVRGVSRLSKRARSADGAQLKSPYNGLVSLVVDWGAEHLSLAEDGIESRGDDFGTRRAPIQFLRDLRDQAADYLIH